MAPTIDKKLRAMFDALAKNKQVLLVKAPLGGMERYAVVLSNGDLITLLYEEEVRKDIDLLYSPGEAAKEDVTMFSNFLKARQGELEAPLSCGDLLNRVEEIVNEKEPYTFAKATMPKREDATPDPESTGDLVVTLKEWMGKDKKVPAGRK
jgi:non-homologous end joining protein Ku